MIRTANINWLSAKLTLNARQNVSNKILISMNPFAHIIKYLAFTAYNRLRE